MALNEGPFGGYTDITNVVSAAAQTEILAQIDKLKALIPDTTEGSSPAVHPDFDAVRPEYGIKMRNEIDALKAAIDAAPTS